MDFDGQRGGTALITGGNSGIGLEIARKLALAGCSLMLPVRNRERGEKAARVIRASAPEAHIHVLDMDLADLASVNRLAAQLVEQREAINLCILNAGSVMLADGGRRETKDGFELTFQTNYLGHFALVQGLLPCLRSGAARVVPQISLATRNGAINWEDLQAKREYHSFTAYRQSKVALGLFGMELDRRSREECWGVTVQLCHPGVVPGSGIAPRLRAMFPQPIVHWAERHLGNPPRTAAEPALAASVAESDGAPAMFAPKNWGGIAGAPRATEPFDVLDDPAAAVRLWTESERLLEGHGQR
ncbi:MAG: SDR family NAD(P)-dependent oxidoreductase [Ancrocorticia sp.]|uniref:SDR family NAD(P)-dependent oxidoreductase n=1 Tax=Ancrocorticia sp. TaxID=2593684 RepID=UPI003F90883A